MDSPFGGYSTDAEIAVRTRAVRMLPIAIPFHSAAHLRGITVPIMRDMMISPQPSSSSQQQQQPQQQRPGGNKLRAWSSFLSMGGDALRVPVLSPCDGRYVSCAPKRRLSGVP